MSLNFIPHPSSKICVSITGDTINDFILLLKKAQEIADFVELRVDSIKDKINPQQLRIISNYLHKKSILCCRSNEHGGKFKGTLKEQCEILQTGNDLGFDYIDVDVAIVNEIHIKNMRSKIIISSHDFNQTPSFETIQKIAEQMRQFNPDVLKFAFSVNTQNDIKTLFKLLINKADHENMIVIGMGHYGKITRLLSPLLGGYLTFASIDNRTSAPGQIDIDSMKLIYQKIGSELHLTSLLESKYTSKLG